MKIPLLIANGIFSLVIAGCGGGTATTSTPPATPQNPVANDSSASNPPTGDLGDAPPPPSEVVTVSTTPPNAVTPPSVPANGVLLFQSGFDNGSSLTSTGAQTAEFRGGDTGLDKPNQWVSDFVNNPNIGIVRLYYEQGDSTQRIAQIVNDPLNANNKVLNYKIMAPHINLPTSSQYTVNSILFDKKARIQMDIYGNNNLKEVYESVRLFIPTDFNKLVNSPYPGTGDWFTLFEFWNNASWNAGSTYNFRFGITLEKTASTSGSPFFFKTEGQKLGTKGYQTVWESKNKNFTVPIGKWMTIEYYIKSGNKGTGRFYFAVQPDGEAKTVVYNLTNDTCHPDDPADDGLSELNPMKLYASGNMVNQMNSRGGVFQVYWDDFKFWKDKRP
jgi:hypothetical protein